MLLAVPRQFHLCEGPKTGVPHLLTKPHQIGWRYVHTHTHHQHHLYSFLRESAVPQTRWGKEHTVLYYVHGPSHSAQRNHGFCEDTSNNNRNNQGPGTGHRAVSLPTANAWIPWAVMNESQSCGHILSRIYILSASYTMLTKLHISSSESPAYNI